MLNKSVTSKNYCIEIENDRFDEIITSEKMENLDPQVLTVGEQLDKVEGITKIEYHGMFGAFIFLTIDEEDDTDDIWKLIEEIIA